MDAVGIRCGLEAIYDESKGDNTDDYDNAELLEYIQEQLAKLINRLLDDEVTKSQEIQLRPPKTINTEMLEDLLFNRPLNKQGVHEAVNYLLSQNNVQRITITRTTTNITFHINFSEEE